MNEHMEYIVCEQCGDLVPNESTLIGNDIIQSSDGQWFCKSCYGNGELDCDEDFEKFLYEEDVEKLRKPLT